jgi:ABC-type uncharacterized transport system
MFRAYRSRLIAGLALLIVMLSGLWFFGQQQPESRKLPIAMMSSIPLQWGEASMGEIAKGEAPPTQFFQLVSEIGEIRMVDDLAALKKSSAALLILVQPRMLSPQELVALDKWVRAGGRAIIFADPALQWPSEFPLGDNRRPLFTSFLSPLFKHWGLELVMPMETDEEQATVVEVGGQRLSVVSHGNCKIDASLLVANCNVGKGRAILMADADMLEDAQLGAGWVSSGQAIWLHDVIANLMHDRPLPDGM